MKKSYTYRILTYILAVMLCTGAIQIPAFAEDLTPQLKSLTQTAEEVKLLIEQCDDNGISTAYETMYLGVAQRSIELMGETGMSNDYLQHNLPICKELLDSTKTALEGYLNGDKTAYSVPEINPDTIAVNGKNLTATVVENGISTNNKPIFLNGYNLGWENRDDSDFLNKLGVNVIPYSMEISRIIGQPNTAYKWEYNSTAIAEKVFQNGNDATLHIVGGNGMIYQMVSLTAGESYTVSFNAKGEQASNVSVKIGTSGNSDFQQNIEASADWKSYQSTYTPSLTYKPEFRIICSGQASVYIDDISLKDSSGNELLANGGFDEWFSAAKDADGLFGVNRYAVELGKSVLNTYKQKGYAAVLSGDFAAMPTYVTAMSGVKDAGASYGTYVLYNPTHPTVIKAIKTYLDAVMPAAKDAGNVVSFMVHNEPSFNSYGKAFYNDKWYSYLETKYVDIDSLNTAYNADYADFASVPMQNTDALTDEQKLTKQYYDWRVFNDTILTDYHNTIADYIHTIAPTIKVGTKIMQEVSPSAALIQHYGTDYEAFGKKMDVNANDGWARPDASGQPIQAQMMWYDYQTSVNNAPVFNMENHFALDQNSLNYSVDYASNVNAMLWQGALHGLAGNQMWLWGRSDAKYPQFKNTTIQYRADVMAQIGRTGLDINRLADEVAALRAKSAKAAILFSETSKSYNRQYENALYKSYIGSLYSGVKTDFVFESNIDKLKNYEMLIIPEATHTTDEVVNAIYDFAQSGKNVLMLADDCLKYNENGEQRAATDIEATIVHGGTRNFTGSTVASVSNIENEVKSFYTSNNAVSVELGDNISDVEIMTTEYDGKLLINLCNYNTEKVTTQVKYKNKAFSRMVNLIDGETFGDTVTLMPNVPMLLEIESPYVSQPIFGKMDFGENPFSADGTGGSIVESNINSLTAGNIFANIDIHNAKAGDAILLMVVKNGNLLKNASMVNCTLIDGKNTKTIVINAEEAADGDYIEAFVWESGTLKPMSANSYRLD